MCRRPHAAPVPTLTPRNTGEKGWAAAEEAEGWGLGQWRW
jgi:hypothetical protein